MIELINLVREAKKIIKNKKLDEFGNLLNESWLLKKSISKNISSNKIDEIYDKAISLGAKGGKLLGAGGGGFLLFYVPKERKKIFLKKLSKLLIIDFKFSDIGSTIIYNSND